MAVAKKGYRKVNYKKQQFIWYINEVKEEVPDQGFVEPVSERYLNVISSNKRFIVRYRMPKSGDEYTTMKVEGELFPREPGAKVIEVPRWRHDSKRYPTADFVRRLIGWCMERPTA